MCFAMVKLVQCFLKGGQGSLCPDTVKLLI